MITDCHMHSWYSGDSESSPESMIQEAIKRGLPAICFTDHEDKDFFCDGKEFVIDTEKYFKEFTELQEKYKEQIDVRIGVELGLKPDLGEFYRNYLVKYPFDFVIGSVHSVGGKDPYYPDFFDGRTDEEAYQYVFDETLTDIKACPDFDTLGHLEYVVRYGREREKHYSYRKYADQIDAILHFLIENGKGLELNTAGLKYGLPFAHPHPDVLRRYKELGGEILTIGADAHKPEHIAYAFGEVKKILTDCGFEYYAEFKNRKPVFRKI